MLPSIRCPHCQQVRPIDARKVWYIQGFLFFCRYGTRAHVGCADCVRNKVLGNLLLTGVIGWWCFPWGMGTPAVLIQNVAALLSGPDQTLMRRLTAPGALE